MAKRIVISGTNHLLKTDDVWGGINTTNTSINIYGQSVPSRSEWGMNHAEVERFIKNRLGNSYGYIRTSESIDSNNFYHLECFNDKNSADKYDEDKDLYKDLLLRDITIPISAVQGDAFAAYLYSNVLQNANIVLVKPDFEIGLRFHAVRISNGERLNMGTKGTITIQRSLDNGKTWTTVGVLEGEITSTDYTNTELYSNINIGKFLQKEYKLFIRLRGSFEYIDDNGDNKISNSTWVLIGDSITYTELSLQCLQDWHTALFADNIKNVGFPVSYLINGAVNKTLHLQIVGNSGTLEVEYQLDESDNGIVFNRDIADAANTYKIFNHGVHAVTAWLTCDNGFGEIITSDILVNRFMVIDKNTTSNPNRPYIMLLNIAQRVSNYVQTKICDYAVFNPIVNQDGTISPSNEKIDVIFYITNYSTTFPNDPNIIEYFTFENKVDPNVRHSLTTTVEIENDSTEDILTYFRVWRKAEDDTMYNFMLESMNIGNLNLTIDNSNSYQPTLGASFILNPKVRNNTEDNPKRILNSQNNSEIESNWEGFDFINDGWVNDDDGVKVLRVLAGLKLNFKFNPFSQFITTPDSSMTLDIDCKINNVTNEDDPIISIFEKISDNYRGLIIKPMEGNIYTKSNTIDSETNFRFREEKRTHISININNAIVPSISGDGLYDPTKFTPASKIALVRVFINGNIEREMKYSVTSPDEFCTGLMSNNGITIGLEGADIDIYSIRAYTNRLLDSLAIVKNYISTLPTTEEKLKIRRENDILTGGRIDVEKIKALGKRVLIMHGSEPYFYNTSVSSVWWEIFLYNDRGEYIPELSGTICKQTGMKPKRLGSTANTYYYSNIQTKIDDAGKITIPLSMFHESIHVSEPYTNSANKTVVGIYGGNLGKYDPVQNEPNEYEYNNGNVTVPDGWIDGNNKYRGKGFMIAENTPLAIKLVLKINYASSMQSHLCGGTRLYNDLHTKIVGKNSLQEAVSSARVSKYTEPVFFFTQQDGSDEVVYRGGGNFGAGKMDKPTWGYVKKLHPMFTLIEGSDNNYPLTDMRVPFTIDPNCSESITYRPDDEGYFYNNLLCLDFDAGKTDDNDIPVNALRDRLAETWNFIYMHSPMIKYYIGTYNNFLSSDESKNTNQKYWCTDGDEQYKLKRYDFVNNRWVDAGLWNSETKTFEKIDLRTHEYTKTTYEQSQNKSDFELLNKELVGAIVAHAKKYIGWYFNIKSLLFHYAFQNHFMAGTDNCSKNTYYVLDPKAKSVTIDGVTKECYLWELHQDDVDTILITDNNGRSTKPYYIDRMHPYDDKDTAKTTSCYEGMFNALFNLVEAMYEETRELLSMLKLIFTAMVGLVNASDNAKGYTNSIWGCLEKYLFSIQKYYPATAFNEQARIRYEWPALLGFVSQGSGARSIAPITQSMGSQLEAEMQFMIRRVVYMASYAAWGNFYDAGKTYNIGIADAADSFSMQAFHLPNETTSNNNYSFNVRPHQYIYPTGMLGLTSIDPHVRVSPYEEYRINIGNTESNDTGLSLLGINYYKSIGNIGDLSVSPNVTFDVRGKRLIEFIAEPTITYIENGKTIGAFRPLQLNIQSKQIKKLSLKGTGIGGTIDVRNLIRLLSLDLRDTYIYDVDLPISEILNSIKYPSTLTKLHIANLPNLLVLTIDGTKNITSLKLLLKQGVDSYSIIQKCFDENAPLSEVVINDINWENTSVSIMNYLSDLGDKCIITGTVSIYEPSLQQNAVTFEIKKKFISSWGNVDDINNPLYIIYNVKQTTDINIFGDSYAHKPGKYYIYVKPANSYANDVTKIKWSISSNSYDVTIDEDTGVINVPKISSTEMFVNTTVTYYRKDNTPLIANRSFGIYDRLAEPGDYVYYDGTYSNILEEKTIVGICFYIDPNNPSDRRAICITPILAHIWGIYSEHIKSLKLESDPGYNCYDTPITNITEYGINQPITESNYRDEINGDKYGFKIFPNNVLVGDLNSIILLLSILDYNVGDSIPKGLYNTLLIMQHRNKILNDPAVNLPIPIKTDTVTEKENLDNYIELVKLINQYYDLYYYPIASYCYAYEPILKNKNEILNNKFKSHNWYLPSCGEMVRISWYFRNINNSNFQNSAFKNAVDNNIINYNTTLEYSTSSEYNKDNIAVVSMSSGNISIQFGHSKNMKQYVLPAVKF